MGRPPPGVDDNLYSSQGRRHRQLDSLHEGQEGPRAVVCRIHHADQNGVPTSQIRIVIRVIIFLLLISTVDAFVKVSVSDSFFLVPEGTNVNLTCSFSDDQGVGLEEVHAGWRWMDQDQDQVMTDGVTTVWNVTQQKGYTVLQVPNITSDANGVYFCIVWIRMSFDYGHAKIQTLNFTHNKNTKVQIIPPHMQSDMWNGPPLRINCTFVLDDPCPEPIVLNWWKLNVTTKIWEKQSKGVSWCSSEREGKGWLNISDPQIGETEGTFLCIVSCAKEGNYGIRTVKAVPSQGQGIRPEYEVYSILEGQDITLSCEILEQHYMDYGWWFKGHNLQGGTKYFIEQRPNGIILTVKQVQRGQDEGQYICWISKDDWWETGITSVYVKIERMTRQTHTSQIPQIPQIPHKGSTQENLVVGLIRDFGKVQNVSTITACLPMPHAAGDPIPWGIIPVPEIPKVFTNISWDCKIVTVTRKELTDGCWMKEIKTKTQCEQMPGFFRWLKGREFPRTCLISPSVLGPDDCIKVPVPMPRERQEEVCQNTTISTTMEGWQAIWGPSLLETYSYLGEVQWCIHWVGTKNQNYSFLHPKHKQWREIVSPTELWNCTQIYTCDTPNNDIGLIPVRMLLQLGCECRGYNHSIKGHDNLRNVNCLTTTVGSPGNLVWVMGHGQWTTHMPVDGSATQITLGVPTLCPYWKSGKLTTVEMQPRRKRDTGTEQDSENWHEPSSGVKFGWVLESLFAPIASYRNREMLFKLMGQTERLAAATKKGFRDVNVQLQATTRMTIQNRMALDLLLLKEHGVCGYLHARDEHCCIHIPNVTHEIENDISQLEQIEGNVHNLQKEAEHNWIGELFSSLGLHLSGWLSSIIQYALIFGIIILVALLVYKCLLGIIVKEGQHTRRIMMALTRKEVILPNSDSPPAIQETRI